MKRVPWNKGKRGIYSEETISKIRDAAKLRKEEKSPHWKGKSAGYGAIHVWINKRWGKAKKCDLCGLRRKPPGKKRFFDWSNKNGNLERSRENWWTLCRKCHKKFDLKRLGRKVKRKPTSLETKKKIALGVKEAWKNGLYD